MGLATRGASALLMLGLVAAAAAAGETPVTLEQEVVTGSRIPRADLEGATPVTVIDRQQIELSGLSTVAEVLRLSPWNTFGSFREVSGSTGQSQAQVSLRGLGAERTLVLIDGRRLPPSPVVGGEAVDLNILPLAAVERIEILREGASAIYGSEAIGGVINIILRRDYEGTEVAGLVERPSQEGADAESVSLVHGGRYDGGRYLFTLEYHDRDLIWSRDRWWSRADPGNGVDFDTTRGLSMLGNTVWSPATWLYEPYLGLCDPTVFAGVYQYPNSDPAENEGTVCAYAYADVAAETNRLERGGGLLRLEHELDETTRFYFRGLLYRVRSFGRFAPAPGGPEDGGLYVNDPHYGPDTWLGLRFYPFGPRNDTVVNLQGDALAGIRGRFRDRFDYDLFVRYNRYEGDYTGRNYLLVEPTRRHIEAGNYDPADPLATPAWVMEEMRTTVGRDMHYDYFNAGITLNGLLSRAALPGGPVSWALGYEYRDEDFADLYDAHSQAGEVIGTAGSSAEGGRHQWAAYGELLLPLAETLEVTAALRHDRYSDAGGATSPQFKVRWQPRTDLVLRAGWGKGFRAPSMSDLHTAPGWGVEVVRDCPPPYACGAEEVWVLSGGNEALDPERSENWGAGFFWTPLEGLSLELDYYQVEVRDAIQSYSAQALLNLEHAGLPLPEGTEVIRDTAGGISEIHSTLSNVSRLRTRGLDLAVRQQLSLGALGSLELGLAWVHVLAYDYQLAPELESRDYAGTWSAAVGPAPDDRGRFDLYWRLGDYGLSWTVDHIDGMEAVPRAIDSWTSHTVALTWEAPWDGRLVAGARNLFDEDPPVDLEVEADYTLFYYLYPIEGRVLFLNYTQRFD